MRFFFVTSVLTAAALTGCGSDQGVSDDGNGGSDYDGGSPISNDEELDGNDQEDDVGGPGVSLPLGEARYDYAMDGSRGEDGGELSEPMPSVFVLNSSPEGNELIELRPEGNDLVMVASYDTGGTSLAMPQTEMFEELGGVQPIVSHGMLHQVGRHLLVANSGSGTITTFRMTPGGELEQTDIQNVGGHPTSIAARGDTVFVAVSAGPDSRGGVMVLEMGDQGDLTPVGQPLALSEPGAQPSQILLAGEGRFLVVTEALSGVVHTWALSEGGRPGQHVETVLEGTPFAAAAFGRHHLIVTEAAPRSESSSVSTYRIERDGTLTAVTESLSTGQMGTSWIDVNATQTMAFSTNVESRTITSYELGRDGSVMVDERIATKTRVPPVGLTVDQGSRLVYVLLSGESGVITYRIHPSGTLVPLGVAEDIGLNGRGDHEILSWQMGGERPDEIVEQPRQIGTPSTVLGGRMTDM